MEFEKVALQCYAKSLCESNNTSEINSPYMIELNLFGEFQSYQRGTRIWVYEIPQ